MSKKEIKVGDFIVPDLDSVDPSSLPFFSDKFQTHACQGLKVVEISDVAGWHGVLWVKIKDGSDSMGLTCTEHPLHGYCWQFIPGQWKKQEALYDPWHNPGSDWEARLREKQNEIWRKKMMEE